MAWERGTWLEEYAAGGRISEIAERHQVSRKTVYKWVERWESGAGLGDRSRAPQTAANLVDPVWRERVRAVRQQQPRWGARKLLWKLTQEHGASGTPSASTVGRLLHEMGLACASRRRWRAAGTGALATAAQPNDVWAVDFKGWCRTSDGQRCEPLTMTDQNTRYLLCCQALPASRTELVRPVMERIFRVYGLPVRLRSDNGPPFGSNGACGLTELAVWWMELGIVCERIQPGRPQQNGRHERMHRTLQEETMQTPAATLRSQQQRFDRFRGAFHEQRPHEALGQQVPAAVYVPASRGYPRRIDAPAYPRDWLVRKVRDGGQVSWADPQGRRQWFLSHALCGKQIGFEPIEEDRWRVWFYQHELGLWDARRWRLWRPGQPHAPVVSR